MGIKSWRQLFAFLQGAHELESVVNMLRGEIRSAIDTVRSLPLEEKAEYVKKQLKGFEQFGKKTGKRLRWLSWWRNRSLVNEMLVLIETERAGLQICVETIDKLREQFPPRSETYPLGLARMEAGPTGDGVVVGRAVLRKLIEVNDDLVLAIQCSRQHLAEAHGAAELAPTIGGVLAGVRRAISIAEKKIVALKQRLYDQAA